mmetsp:Transcript_20262/g.37824  ORF Transcript_20262/g.37824 Transcript_20262/m.37824 type:complete len:467 (+) Transcript_20262:1927-3327(+)
MLYSDYLWDKIDVVIDHWDRERQVTNNIVNLYLRIRKLSLAYADGLDKQIHALSLSKQEFDEHSPIACLRDYAVAVSKSQRTFAEVVLEEIATPLQSTLTMQTVGLKDVIMQGRKHSKKLQACRKKQGKPEKQQDLSGNELRKSVLSRLTSELSVLNRQKSLDTGLSMQKYLEDNSNEMKQIIDTMQAHEIDKLRVVQKTLTKFGECAKAQGIELSEFGSHLHEKIMNFNVEKSLQSFIMNHKEQQYTKSKTFPIADSTEESSDDNKNEFSHIMQNCWDGKAISDSDWQTIRTVLSTHHGRAECLSWINQHRANGSYEIADMNAIGEVLNALLDEVHKDVDVINGSHCIVLSQTFHDSSHQFLQEKIMKHAIWHDTVFWDSAFVYKVNDDMTQFTQFCSLEFGNEADLENKFNSVIISQVTTFLTILRSFEIPEADIQDFIQRQAKKFSLTPPELEVLMLVVNHVS